MDVFISVVVLLYSIMKKDKIKTSQVKQQKFPHFPFENPPFRLSMGLLTIPEQEWFEIFDQKERFSQMKEKRKLLTNQHAEVFMANPSALKASREALLLILKHIPAIRPDLYTRKNDSIRVKPYLGYEGEEWSTKLNENTLHPLDLAARLIQEDLIIMLPADSSNDGTAKGWWLAAGSIAFPSRWNLKEKFEQPMEIIHAPVPFYKEQLQESVNNFFNNMSGNKIYARRNWSLYDNPSLRQDINEHNNVSIPKLITSKNAGEQLWLRVERQTLRKLNETGAILFTIRIHLRQVKDVVNEEGVANRLAKALSALPKKMHEYKRTDLFSDSVQGYLRKFCN